MTTPSEEEARALIEKWGSLPKITRHSHRDQIDGILALVAALASAVSTPPSEDWEYGVGWEYPSGGACFSGWAASLEAAHQYVVKHPDDGHGTRNVVVRRHPVRHATTWEPVPAVPVLPTEPGTELEVRSDAPTPVTPTEPEEGA